MDVIKYAFGNKLSAEKYYEMLEAKHKEFIWFENSAHFPQYTENDKFCDLLLNISNRI